MPHKLPGDLAPPAHARADGLIRLETLIYHSVVLTIFLNLLIPSTLLYNVLSTTSFENTGHPINIWAQKNLGILRDFLRTKVVTLYNTVWRL